MSAIHTYNIQHATFSCNIVLCRSSPICADEQWQYSPSEFAANPAAAGCHTFPWSLALHAGLKKLLSVLRQRTFTKSKSIYLPLPMFPSCALANTRLRHLAVPGHRRDLKTEVYVCFPEHLPTGFPRSWRGAVEDCKKETFGCLATQSLTWQQ